MKKLSKVLKNRIDVYSKIDNINDLGEKSYSYGLLQSVWAEILPTNTESKEEVVKGEALRAKTTHKITVRTKAIKKPQNDMYFIFKGQKYEVMYFLPNYKGNDFIEFYCKLIIETEEDYENDES